MQYSHDIRPFVAVFCKILLPFVVLTRMSVFVVGFLLLIKSGCRKDHFHSLFG